MAYNHTLSAILRGQFLIEPGFAQAHLPMVQNMLQGKVVSWGDALTKDAALQMMGSNSCALANYGVRPGADLSSATSDYIAHINLSGPIMKHGDICSYGANDYTNLINALTANESCKGILLNIDGPGGQASGIASLGEAINNASRVKPVIGVIDDGMAASAHMWIASQCDELYCTKQTDSVGSIGAYTTIADWAKQMRELFKLDTKEVYAPQSTDKNKTYYDALAGNEDGLKADLKILVDNFINAVQESRGGRLTSDEWNTGKMYHAKDALRIGLIDGIQPYKKVLARLEDLININEEDKAKANKTQTQTLKNKMMAFEKTLTAATATEFAVVDGGFLLTEENLNSIETNLAAGEAAYTDLVTATATIENLNNVAAANATALATANASIVSLTEKVKLLGDAESGDGTVVTTEKDETTEKKKVASYNDPNSSFNQKAVKAERRQNMQKVNYS